MSKLVNRAESKARTAHDGLTYGPDDRPYVWHLEKTAKLASRLGYQDEVVAACWLHDIVEDTEVAIKDLQKDFSSPIISAIEAVTFSMSDTVSKIKKAKSDPIGHVVKYCDASVNFSASALDGPRFGHTQWEVSVERYPVYLAELLIGLPTPRDIEKYLNESDTRL